MSQIKTELGHVYITSDDKKFLSKTDTWIMEAIREDEIENERQSEEWEKNNTSQDLENSIE